MAVPVDDPIPPEPADGVLVNGRSLLDAELL